MSLFFKLFTRHDNLTKYSLQLSKLTEEIEKTNNKLQKNKHHSHYYKLFVLTLISVVLSGVIQWALPYLSLELSLHHKAFLNISTLVWPFLYYKYLQIRHRVLLKKLTVLRDRHSSTLEELKNKTSFYNTAAIINRYSAGEHGDQDEGKILDEELLSKKKQLDDIRNELQENSTKSKEETDKWFDKCLNVLGGGADLLPSQPIIVDPINSQTMVQIICPSCNYESGLYKIKTDTTSLFNCPKCDYKQNEPTEQS